MRATLSIYEERLADLPADDVREVIRRFGDSRLGDGHWAPTPGDICREVYALMEKRQAAEKAQREREKRDAELAEQLARRKRIAENFERRTQMEIDRAKAMVARFKAGIPEGADKPNGWRAPTKAEAEMWLEAHAGGVGVKAVTDFSPTLTQMLHEMAWGEAAE
jgi:hypothetical protein